MFNPIQYLSRLIASTKQENPNSRHWHIEFEGEMIGELCSPQYEDMFWVSYTIAPKNQASAIILFDAAYWNADVFKFKNKVTLKYAENAIASILVANQLTMGKVSMRALY